MEQTIAQIIAPVINADGSLTYWSVRSQVWETHAFQIPHHELAAMNDDDRERVRAHIRAMGGETHGQCEYWAARNGR